MSASKEMNEVSLQKPQPFFVYPPELPVSARREEISQAIADNQVVVISGQTGSGKTTQLPKLCLELGRGKNKLIGHTQPRRIAARSVADRIAQEMRTKLGEIVGYQVRFHEDLSADTRIKLMTDGILLAEIRTDPLLKKYDTIIIDEAHERSLNIDFLLGYLTQLLPKRPDLKLIITSATIDAQGFVAHFQNALGFKVPSIEVSGRSYPVEVRYRPLNSNNEDKNEYFDLHSHNDNTKDTSTARSKKVPDTLSEPEGICLAVEELFSEGPGDILVFLAGEADIRETELALQEHLTSRYPQGGQDVEILPLYARLSPAEQQRIFAPHQKRRIVLATNVAETSLTVPGIKYVIDPGLARISRYSNRTKIQRLPIEEISQASAKQRAGRCGRTSPGIVIRLYSEENFLARPEYTDPEILRTSLASVILSMEVLGLGAVADFPFLDSPDPKAIRDGEQLLWELGALKRNQPETRRNKVNKLSKISPLKASKEFSLTKLGYQLAKFPIDPRLARMIIAGDKLGCATEILIIVAALGMQDVRLRPLEYQQEAAQLHQRFLYPGSDFLTYLNLWRYIRCASKGLSNSAFRRLCKREFLHYLRCREWQDLVLQLRQVAKECGIRALPLSHPNWDRVSQVNLLFNQGVPSGKTPRNNTGSTAKTEPIGESGTKFSCSELDPSLADSTLPNQQVTQACQALTKDSSGDQIHQALLAGLFSQVANWSESKKTYLGTRSSSFAIWPGSALAGKEYEWIMCAELVETSRIFARNCARIKPEWIEYNAQVALKYHYGEISWSSSRLQAMVEEKVTLYGLTIRAGRLVPLASLGDKIINRDLPVSSPDKIAWESTPTTNMSAIELARSMFIREVLVKGKDYPFQKRNWRTLAQAQEIAHRSRESGLVADEEQLAAWLETKVGSKVTNQHSFWSWFKKQNNPQILDYPLELLLPSDQGKLSKTSAGDSRQYSSGEKIDTSVGTRVSALSDRLQELAKAGLPDYWHGEGLKLPLSYCFAPGNPRDGVSVDLSYQHFRRQITDGTPSKLTDLSPQIAGLNRLSPEKFEWLVPGFLLELLGALLKSLPKASRRELGPLPQAKDKIFSFFRWSLHNPDLLSTEVTQDRQSVELKQAQELAASLQRLAAWNNGAKTLAEVEQLSRASQQRPTPKENTKNNPPSVSGKPETLASSQVVSQSKAYPYLPLSNPEFSLYQVFSQALKTHGVVLSPTEYRQLILNLPLHLKMQFTCKDQQVIHFFLLEQSKGKGGKASRPSRFQAIELIKVKGTKLLWTRDFNALKDLIIQAVTQAEKKSSPRKNSSAASKSAPLNSHYSDSVQDQKHFNSQVTRSQSSALSAPVSSASTTHNRDVSPHSLNKYTGSERAVSSLPELQAIPTRIPHPWGSSILTLSPQDPDLPLSEATQLTAISGKSTHPRPQIHLVPAARSDWKRPLSYYALAEQVSGELSLSPKRITSRWNHQLTLALAHTPYSSTSDLIADLELVTVLRCFRNRSDSIQQHFNQAFSPTLTEEKFKKLTITLAQKLRDEYEDSLFATVKLAARIMQEKQKLDQSFGKSISLELLPLVNELKNYPYNHSGFLYDYWEYLEHLPRFLKARRLGLEKAINNPSNRSGLEKTLAELKQAQSLLDYKVEEIVKIPPLTLPLEQMRAYLHARFLQEELLVSLLAQELKTSEKISLIRLKKQLQK